MPLNSTLRLRERHRPSWSRVVERSTPPPRKPPRVPTRTLKYVVESSVFELGIHGGGTITFDADTFDLGNDHFELDNVNNVLFQGQGMASTVIVNNSSDADDTEVFDIVHATVNDS